MADPSTDQALGLEAVHKPHEVQALGFCDPPRCIEPYKPNRSVLGQEFFQLRLDLGLQVSSKLLLRPIRVVPVVAAPPRMMPVLVLGIVEAHLDSGPPAFGRQFRQGRLSPEEAVQVFYA